jgi:sarcosine oxidase subunit alpha
MARTRCFLTSVTEQWSVATLSGPHARAILEAADISIDLSDTAFPFMSMKEGYISGLPARLFRISFTGELSYEINVPARYGVALWTALMKAGEAFGITPYGTEAMHVLRAEKGVYHCRSGNGWHCHTARPWHELDCVQKEV